MTDPTEAAARLVDQHKRMVIAKRTDPDAGLLHYQTAQALARRHPDKYVIERVGRQRVIQQVANPRPAVASITITPDALQAISDWVVSGPSMAQVTITEEDDGSWRACQGDDYAEVTADGGTS
jgi:hypothetical protein